MKRAELVFIPSPGIGHLASTVEFAKLLINRDDRLSITFLVMKLPYDSNTQIGAYTESLASSSLAERIRFIELYSDKPNREPHISSSPQTFIENQKPLVREAVCTLTESNSGPDWPRLAAFIVDMFCTTMSDVANEYGVPTFVFYTSGVACLGLMLHLHTLRERDNVDCTEFKAMDIELKIPSFMNPVPAKVLPSAVLEKQWVSIFVNYAKRLKEVKGIIVNSFEEMETHAVRSFRDIGEPLIYPVGPLLNLKGSSKSGSQVSDEVIKWLDDQPKSSVVFLCFGSMGGFDEDQEKEIAHALEESGTRFLWAIRKPAPSGPPGLSSDYANLEEVLPEGFLDRTAKIGKVIGWAPQVQILSHQAVGGFVSHCGWNSTLESIYFGVPIATWPLYAEQQINAFQLVTELRLGVEVAMDYRAGSKTILSAEKIAKGIKDLMEEDSEIRKKVKEMSEKSRSTFVEDGCSCSSLDHLIDDIISTV